MHFCVWHPQRNLEHYIQLCMDAKATIFHIFMWWDAFVCWPFCMKFSNQNFCYPNACMPYTPQLTDCMIILLLLLVVVLLLMMMMLYATAILSHVHCSIPSLRKLWRCFFLIVGDPQWQCIFHSLCQQIYDEITLPLLLMVQQLQAQKHLLFDLLKKKDIEITEYKLEGAQLSRSEW